MSEMVEQSGLDLETFYRLTVRLEIDPGFRQRVEQLLEDQEAAP